MIHVERLQGTDLAKALSDVARLRIEVFRSWPYLYDGDMAYEEAYLQVYRESLDAILVAAFDGRKIVGASTGAPMVDHAEDFGVAFSDSHPRLERIFTAPKVSCGPPIVVTGSGIAFLMCERLMPANLAWNSVHFVR